MGVVEEVFDGLVRDAAASGDLASHALGKVASSIATEATEAVASAIVRAELQASMLLDAYRRGHYRVLIFNLEGVLTRYQGLPELLYVSESIERALYALGSHPDVLVVIKSPRSSETLTRLLGHLPVTLAAEHGMFMRWHFPEFPDEAAPQPPVHGRADPSSSSFWRPKHQHVRYT